MSTQIQRPTFSEVALHWEHYADSLERRNEQLVAALHECEAYLADREDVIDGDYGEPRPNKEMTLLIEVRKALSLAR